MIRRIRNKKVNESVFQTNNAGGAKRIRFIKKGNVKFYKESKSLYTQSFDYDDDWDDISMELDNVDTLMDNNYLALDNRHEGDSYDCIEDILYEESRASSEIRSVEVYEIDDGIRCCDIEFSNHDGGYTRCFANGYNDDFLHTAVEVYLKDHPITKEDTDELCDWFVETAEDAESALEETMRIERDSGVCKIMNWIFDYNEDNLEGLSTPVPDDGKFYDHEYFYDIKKLKKIVTPELVMERFKHTPGSDLDEYIICFLVNRDDSGETDNIDHLIVTTINKLAGNASKSYTPSWWNESYDRRVKRHSIRHRRK